jgi:hypothetical protein
VIDLKLVRPGLSVFGREPLVEQVAQNSTAGSIPSHSRVSN